MARAPSAWDAAARARGAGHDEMQEAVYEWLTGQLDTLEPIRFDGRTFVPGVVTIEYPLRRDSDFGDIVAFADIAVIYAWVHSGREGRNLTEPGAFDRRDFFFVFYELKPDIRSVGGLIRQCVALAHVATQCRYQCSVYPVVYHDDPKLPLLDKFSEQPVCAIGRDILTEAQP